MTCIAYDSKTLAADSMTTNHHGFFAGNAKKLYLLKSGGMLGTAGMSDARSIISLVDSVKDGNDLPSRAELEATRTDGVYLLVLPDKSVWVLDIEYDDDGRFFASVDEIRERYVAIGHGEDYARAALAMGEDSVSAVKLACRFSAFCRGPVQTMVLGQKQKTKIKRKRQPKAGIIEE